MSRSCGAGVDGVFEKGDRRRQAGQRRRIVLGGHVDDDLRCCAGAGVVGHLDRQRAARRRRARRIGIGQVLDQRLDRRRCCRAVEGDDEIAAGAAGDGANGDAAVEHRAGRKPDLAAAIALVADRQRILGQQARDDQRAVGEIVVRIGEAGVGVEQLGSGVDGVLEEGDGRREACQRRCVVPGRHVD